MRNRPLVVLNLTERVKDALTFARSVASALANPAPPLPTTSLATFDADIAGLDAAEAAILTRMKGAVEERDVKLRAVLDDLGQLRAHVQRLADASPGEAQSIIQSAGMSVKKVGVHPKGELSAKPGRVSGSAHLVAKAAAGRAFYDWQDSSTPESWKDVSLLPHERRERETDASVVALGLRARVTLALDDVKVVRESRVVVPFELSVETLNAREKLGRLGARAAHEQAHGEALLLRGELRFLRE
jgi:hypothetical protein